MIQHTFLHTFTVLNRVRGASLHSPNAKHFSVQLAYSFDSLPVAAAGIVFGCMCYLRYAFITFVNMFVFSNLKLKINIFTNIVINTLGLRVNGQSCQ